MRKAFIFVLMFAVAPAAQQSFNMLPALPATCVAGSTVILSTPPWGTFYCEAMDIWTPMNTTAVPMAEVDYFNTTGTTLTIPAVSNGSTNLVRVNVPSVFSSIHDHF